MKLYKSFAIALAAGVGLLAVSSCSDYDYDTELARAEIFGPFTLKSPAGNTYKSSIDGDVITVKINPFAEVESELNGAVPCFYLPMGATCSPSPTEPQDFTKDVQYTITSGDGKNHRVITVKWGPSDPLPFGEGYSFSRRLCEKLYPELGYPGDNLAGEVGDVPNGDILFFPAFCGDKLVGFSRVYAWGNNNGRNIPANPSLAFKMWDVNTLEESNATLNLGPLSASQIVNITNDWVGHMVAATGGMNGVQSDVYYWTSPDAAPVKVGTLPEPVYTHPSHTVDASMFIQVAGDITGDAVISYMPTKTATGDHVAVNVKGGAIADHKTISTGYPSNDKAWFQMISFFGTDYNSNYLVGETEGDGNGSVKGYYNSASGATVAVMGAYLNGVPMTDGVAWWSATGKVSARGGSRRPFMMAMNVNGKEYSLVLTGYDWTNRSQMMTGDFSSFLRDDAMTYDMRGYQMTKLGASGLAAGSSFGGCGCWYWNDEAHEGRAAIWNGREGLATFLFSSYE